MKRSVLRTAQKGFTLIELMIVVAIIGILAAVALPAYQNYTIKAKVGAALSSVASIKTAVALCFQENGNVPDTCDSIGSAIPVTAAKAIPFFTPTKEIASAITADGIITVTFAAGIGSGVDGLAFTIEPTANDTTIIWLNKAAAITNATAKELLLKNNIVATPAV